MTYSANASRWIAAELKEGRLTAWLMQGKTAEERVVAPAEDNSAADALGTLARRWNLPAGTEALLSGDPAGALQTVPAKAAGTPSAAEPDGILNLQRLPGLRQDAPAGLMRSAPARVAGFLAQHPNWDGVICLPGAKTHWVLVSADEIVSFQSFATVALARAAEAAFGLGGAGAIDPDRLADSLPDLISRPERLAARLAELQAAGALDGLSPVEMKGRLWGCWLGAELAASRPYWLGQNLALIADEDLAAPYSAALQSQGLAPEVCAAEDMALAGLIAARNAEAG